MFDILLIFSRNWYILITSVYIADILPFGSSLDEWLINIYEHFRQDTGHPNIPPCPKEISKWLNCKMMFFVTDLFLLGEEFCWCKLDIRYKYLFVVWGLGRLQYGANIIARRWIKWKRRISLKSPLISTRRYALQERWLLFL